MNHHLYGGILIVVIRKKKQKQRRKVKLLADDNAYYYYDIIVYGKNLRNISPTFQLLLQKVQSEIELIISNENMLQQLIESK